MRRAVPYTLKRMGEFGLSVAPHCRFERCIFLIGHMRCGSTALSSILCSRAEISGYGESHVAYSARTAPGALALNQLRKRKWRATAPYLFDKILHDRLDADPFPDFFRARAIFVVRDPDASVRSILQLFRAIGSSEYPTPAAAAAYYAGRLARMRALWCGFPPTRRIGMRYEVLVAAPQAELRRLSAFLRLAPELANAYQVGAFGNGAGDPINAHRHSGIVPGGIAAAAPPCGADLAGDEMVAARTAYAAFCGVAFPAATA